jgi:tetratricopeptide (TPR) repeat protein
MSSVTDKRIQQTFLQAYAEHQQGNLQEAARLYKQILDWQPEHADALHFLGLVAHQFGSNDTAISLIKRAVNLQPANPAIHYNLGSIYQAQRARDLAIQHYQLCLQYQPANVEALANLGVLYQEAWEMARAEQAYRQALQCDANHVGALLNLGTMLYQQGQPVQSLPYFEQLLLSRPMDAVAHNKRASVHLLQGKLQQGWREMEWMYFSPSFLEKNPPRLIPFRKWKGEPVPVGALLLIADQGVGDAVMFASCIADVLAKTDTVILECDPRLVSLLQDAFPTLRVIGKTPQRDFYWN